MDWTEQTQQMMRSWTETQKKLWEGWVDAGTKAAAPAGETGAWGDWFSQWQQMARRNLEAWTAGADGGSKDLAQRLFTGEGAFLRFVELAMDALKATAPKIQGGEDWAELLRRYIEQMKEQMSQGAVAWLSPEVAAAATSDLPELWKLFGAQMKNLGAPWLQSLQETPGHLGDVMSGDRRAFIKTSNLFMDTFEGTLGKFAAAPSMGFTREFQEKVTKAFETWVEVRKAEVEFYTESVNIGFRSLETLLQELVQKGERGEKIASFRELFDLWVSTADKSFFEAASTEGFADVQGRLVNAAMHYRIHEREVAEVFLTALHLPTRELDDAYRHMYEMRKEVKALRKELAQLRREMTPAEGNRDNAPEPRATTRARKTEKAGVSRAPAATRSAKK